MAFILSIINEKGGSGKSTLARLLATEFTREGWDVKIADLDPQGTCVSWALYRSRSKIDPPIAVEPFRTISDALKHASAHNMMIIDSHGRADRDTLGIAKVSDLVLIPTKPTQDDLAPSITLAHELKENGINQNIILFVLNQTYGQNPVLRARNAIRKAGYRYVKEFLPAKDSYSIAMQDGKSPSETPHPSTKTKAIELYEGINEAIAKLQEEKLVHE
jgi:chromosome partitioning protein